MKKATKWDASENLSTEEDMAAYLNAVLEDSDTSVIAAALGDIARAKGMTQLAKETGITRDGLYKAYKAPLNTERIAVLPPDWDDGDE